MLKPIDLTLENFGSFGPPQTIPLADLGLVLIEGENRKSKSAGSNGSGKSTILEGFGWVLFGKTTKGVLADKVINRRAGKNCCGMVRLRESKAGAETTYCVRRYRKHDEFGNGLIFEKRGYAGKTEDLSGVDAAATQEKIVQFLGASFGLFCTAQYFMQKNIQPFSMFTDKQIKETFMESMDMTRFSAALERVREKIKVVRPGIAKIEGRIARLTEEAGEIAARNAEYQRKDDEWKTKASLEIAEMKAQAEFHAEKLKELEGLASVIKALETTLETKKEAVIQIKALETQLEALKLKRTPFSEKLAVLAHSVTTSITELKRTESAKANASARVGTKCPECGKPIDLADVSELITATQAKIDAYRVELAKKQTVVGKAGELIASYDAQIAAVQANYERLAETVRDIPEILAEIARQKIEAGRKKEHQEAIVNLKIRNAAAKAEKSKASPFEDLIAAEAKAAKRADAAETLSAVLATAADDLEYLLYWERAFGYAGIPSFLLDGATPLLNERANHYAAISCDGEIEIKFETTTKGKDKFSIGIEHRDGADSYKGVSGGEAKRAMSASPRRSRI